MKMVQMAQKGGGRTGGGQPLLTIALLTPELVDRRISVGRNEHRRTASAREAKSVPGMSTREVRAMWIVFSVFLVLWILSVEFVFPVALTITFFAFVIGSAAVALMPGRNEEMEYDDGE
jgi:hypothetical protein